MHKLWTNPKQDVLRKETVALTNSNPQNTLSNSDKNVMMGVIFRLALKGNFKKGY